MKEKLDMNLVYKNYFNVLKNIAFNYTKNEDLAKDIVQETMIKIWLKQDLFDINKGSFFNWINSILKRTFYDYVKKNNKVDFIRNNESNAWDNFKCPCINIDTIDLELNLNKINLKYRFCLYQSYIIGLTHVQISEKFKIPLGSVKSYLKKGLEELKLIYT